MGIFVGRACGKIFIHRKGWEVVRFRMQALCQMWKYTAVFLSSSSSVRQWLPKASLSFVKDSTTPSLSYLCWILTYFPIQISSSLNIAWFKAMKPGIFSYYFPSYYHLFNMFSIIQEIALPLSWKLLASHAVYSPARTKVVYIRNKGQVSVECEFIR